MVSSSSSSAAAPAAAAGAGGGGGDEPDKFMWQANEDLWVMGSFGDELLRKIRAKGPREDPLPAPGVPVVPWRRRCQAMGGAGCQCVCTRYSPAIMLPLSLFDGLELRDNFQAAAKQILGEAFQQAAFLGGVQAQDFILEVLEKPTPSRWYAGGGCHLARFRLRKEKRLVVLELAGARRAEIYMEQLDSAEFEVNKIILPTLLHWSDEYRVVKGLVAAQKAQLDAEAKQTSQELMDAAEAVSLSVTGVMSGARGKHLALGGAEEARAIEGGAAGGRTCTALALAEPAEKSGILAVPDAESTCSWEETFAAGRVLGGAGPARAVMMCSCGHSEVWHVHPQAEAQDPPSGRSPSLLALEAPPGAPLRRTPSTSALGAQDGTLALRRKPSSSAIEVYDSAPPASTLRRKPSSSALEAHDGAMPTATLRRKASNSALDANNVTRTLPRPPAKASIVSGRVVLKEAGARLVGRSVVAS